MKFQILLFLSVYVNVNAADVMQSGIGDGDGHVRTLTNILWGSGYALTYDNSLAAVETK